MYVLNYFSKISGYWPIYCHYKGKFKSNAIDSAEIVIELAVKTLKHRIRAVNLQTYKTCS